MATPEFTLLRAIFQADQAAAKKHGATAASVLAEQRAQFQAAPPTQRSYISVEQLWQLEYGGAVAPMYSVSEAGALLRLFGLPIERAELGRIVKQSGGVRRGSRWYIPRLRLAALLSSSA